MIAVATQGSSAHVAVTAFDVHLWSKPFDAAQFNPQVHFLWSSSDYPKMRSAGQKVDLGNLVLFPLHDEIDVERNTFWWSYKIALDKLAPGPATALGDAREFLWPLRCRPKGLDIVFSRSQATRPPKVRVTIWLWPFGWSSAVHFKFAAPFSLDDLQDLGINLRTRSPGPFTFEGKTLSLSEVFKLIAERVRRDIGTAGNLPADAPHLGRHIVSAVQLPRAWQAPPTLDRWPAADQLRLIGALRGRKIALGELGPGGNGKNYLTTPLGPGNVAITDFIEGTMLLLRHWKDRRPVATRETNHCLFENVRAFSTVHFALHRFAQYADDQQELAAAVANARAALSHLPNEYPNRFGRNFEKHFAPDD